MWTGGDKKFEHFCRAQCTIQSAIPHQQYEPAHTIDWVLDRRLGGSAPQHRDCADRPLERARPGPQARRDDDGLHRPLPDADQGFLPDHECAIVVVVAHPTKAIVNTGEQGCEPRRYRRFDELVQQMRQRADRGARGRQHRQGDQRQGPRDRRRQDRLLLVLRRPADRPIHPAIRERFRCPIR
jgi:hypothetical protein